MEGKYNIYDEIIYVTIPEKRRRDEIINLRNQSSQHLLGVKGRWSDEVQQHILCLRLPSLVCIEGGVGATP